MLTIYYDLFFQSAATIAVSSLDASDTTEKRSIKKYGSKLDATGSPSRSRSATKELILPPDDSLMCAPEFTVKLQDITVSDGDQLHLSCTIKGDPEPQVMWTRNGKVLTSSDIMDLKYKNGVASLNINEVFPEDEGEYVCKATNSIGSLSTKSKITVARRNGRRRRGCRDDRSHSANRRAILLLDTGIYLTAMRCPWTVRSDSRGVLIACRTNKRSCLLMCKMFNLNFIIFISAMKSSSGHKSKSGDKPPRIVSHLSSAFVKDGDPVTLSCRIIGADKFDVVWLHNNKEIKPSKDFEYANEVNIYKLNIAEIFPEDSGTYTCEAFNDAGESFSSCTLNVLGMCCRYVVTNLIFVTCISVPNEEPKSPVFKTFPQSATVQEGESVSFDCETEKVPLKVLWLKDGNPVEESSPRFQFVQDGKKKFKFQITSCTPQDVGQYSTKAVGKKNETFAAFSLNVYSAGEL
ncbi:hypothetical protein PR048_013012 [Dryococelus australis]|uniref:Ig-like domain-containing protein n=1 Tax=Dryococelus australis TaxID=614101 RepID=A0ABQ9HQY9_9NEOP|nr:hypothetical protein PR048_013012 [Dryococelus australis]